MSAAAYRARSATELIDATFQILRANFPQLFTLAALWYVPMAIVPRLLMPAGLQTGTTASFTGFGAGFFIWFFVWFILFLILSAIFQTAMFYASSDAYLGRTVELADVLKRAVRRAGTMAGGYFLQTVCIMLASLLLIIPGIYVGLGLFAVPCVIAFENSDASSALSRSMALSKGLKGHIFLTSFLAGIIYGVGGLIISIGAALLAGGLQHPPTVLSQTVSVLGSCVLLPAFPLVFTLLYYDARIRKEGFDIELMAQQVGGSATGAKPQPA